MTIRLIQGNCKKSLRLLKDNSVDSIVTDPPYGLSFMGKKWDYDVPSKEIWKECLRVLKPGGYLLAFAGTRTQHRMACNIEDAGFEIRDMIAWVYGSGFPKSLNIGKAVDKLQRNDRKIVGQSNGANKLMEERPCNNASEYDKNISITKGTSEWEGWGSNLKPSLEPITMARKPLEEKTIAKNVLKWGTGGINIDGCRVGIKGGGTHCNNRDKNGNCLGHNNSGKSTSGETIHAKETEIMQGRFPANFIHDGSEEVVNLLNESSRFFYCAKTSKKDRNEGLEEFEENVTNDGRKKDIDNAFQRGTTKRANIHPTVKPTALMSYLVRLVTPKNGTCLDPFMGSGSTGKACVLEHFNFIGIEMDEEYIKIAEARINYLLEKQEDLFTL